MLLLSGIELAFRERMVDICALVSVIAVVLLCIPIAYIVMKNIKQKGFLCGNMFIAIYVLFYIFVPIAYLVLPLEKHADISFVMLINTKEPKEIASAMFFAVIILYVFVFSYCQNRSYLVSYVRTTNRDIHEKELNEDIDKKSEKIVAGVANVCSVIGIGAILLCIIATGGLRNYLALGTWTRGMYKDSSIAIDAKYLKYISLSSIILVSPYLFFYLSKATHKKVYRNSFIVSFCFSIIYLLYNQGRLPILLFIIPFILCMKVARKYKLMFIMLIGIGGVLLFEPLQNLFHYLSTGSKRETTSLMEAVDTFVTGISFAFSSFLNRTALVDISGYRYGIDFVIWPLVIIPASILKIVGIDKASISLIGYVNSIGMEKLAGFYSGGVPTDLLTFCFYQFGTIGIIVLVIIWAKFTRFLDKKMNTINYKNEAITIVVIRIGLLFINLVGNFDFSVFIKNRIDFIILVVVLLYIEHNSRVYERKVIK